MKKALILLYITAGLLFVIKTTIDLNKVTNPFTIPVASTPTPYPTPVNEEKSIVSLINEERLSVGLDGLKLNYLLRRSAQLKAEDLCELGYWAHTNPDGVTYGDLMGEVGYDYAIAGEDLARGFETDSGAFKGFVNSPTHYALIVGEYYEDIGIGRCREYLVVHFGVL